VARVPPGPGRFVEANSAEEVRVLDELAQMRAEDPEGYRAVMDDLRQGADEGTPSEADPARAHAEHLLDVLRGSAETRDPLHDLLARAHAEAASGDITRG
jgi:hypothetical protein